MAKAKDETTTAAPAAAPKKPTPAPAKAEASAPVAVTVNGVNIESGDVKGGGSAKKTLATLLPVALIAVEANFNPRKTIDEAAVEELADNMKRHGQLQNIVVRPHPKTVGKFYVVAGHRRLLAAQKLGWETINTTVRTDLDDAPENKAKAKAIAIAENNEGLRVALNPIELGNVFRDLGKANDWTPENIAKETGHNIGKVRRCLNIVEAPADIQTRVADGSLPVASALELSKLDETTRTAVAERLKDAVTAPKIRQAAKEIARTAQAAAGADTTTTDGKANNRRTGADRAANLVTWKSSKAKQEMISKIAYYYIQALGTNEEGTSEFHEMRGNLAFAFWDRGTLETPVLPAHNPESAQDKKVVALFTNAVKAEAKKYTPPAPAATEGAEAAEAAAAT